MEYTIEHTMENTTERHGTSWNIMEYPWNILEYHGISWNIMGYHRIS